MHSPFRLLAAISTLLLASATLHAQAPGLSTWPAKIPHGLRLELTTTTGPFVCRLQSIDTTQLVCAGQKQAPTTTFNRADILSITDAPQEKLWPHIGLGILKYPAIAVGVGLLCAVLGGGIACTVIGTAGGIALFAGLFALPIVNIVSETQHRAPRTKLLYVAPATITASVG